MRLLCVSPLYITFLSLLPMQRSSAHECAIGVFVGSGCCVSVFCESPLQVFDAYVLLFVENVVSGVAYRLTWPAHLMVSPVDYGPSGTGINVPRAGGDTIGLGQCALGFDGASIQVAHYSVLALTVAAPWETNLGPNTDEHADYPVFASCADEIVPCAYVINLQQAPGCGVISTESHTIGQIKAIYSTP